MREDFRVLADYIRGESGYEGELDPATDLLEANILDSFSIVKVAVFVQEQFDIEFEPEDFSRANLASLISIVALINKHRANNC